MRDGEQMAVLRVGKDLAGGGVKSTSGRGRELLGREAETGGAGFKKTEVVKSGQI